VPILLEANNVELLKWCENPDNWFLTEKEQDSEKAKDTHFDLHLRNLLEMAKGKIALGPKPDDLLDVICDLSLAGPGTCALRALSRLKPDTSFNMSDPNLLSGAVMIATGLRKLFNVPEAIAMLRSKSRKPYWQSTLNYNLDGNIQSVLDEYVHILYEPSGLELENIYSKLFKIAKEIKDVLSLSATNITLDELQVKGSGFTFKTFSARCRFALRFGSNKKEDEDNNNRAIHTNLIRKAFNSPFKPFILASTSIAQEGLDFHGWCYKVVHWNLPNNPIDLEQREGRVQRFKGLAIRKNIAHHYGLKALAKVSDVTSDPWDVMFGLAVKDRDKNQNDLVPFWIFDGPAKVERQIPLLPYSREEARYKQLKKDLTIYRAVFGQPRQEDLLSSLESDPNIDPDELLKMMISLSPPKK
jgi:hypothetical protein